MKSHLFRMKYLLAGIYIICVVFTCFNARFYHTPLAKISSVTEKETMSRKGTRDAEEYYYTQKITARILNGTHKGEEISISNEYTTSQVQKKKQNTCQQCQITITLYGTYGFPWIFPRTA